MRQLLLTLAWLLITAIGLIESYLVTHYLIIWWWVSLKQELSC